MSRETLSHIWTFSPSSITLLEQCRSAVPPPDESNKWWQRFGQNASNSSINNSSNVDQDPNEVITIEDSPEDNPAEISQEENIPNALDELTDSEPDLISKFDELQEKSKNDPQLLIKLVQNTPKDIVNGLIEQVFDRQELNNEFLADVFEYFIPTYIKKYSGRICIDLLKKTNEKYPEFFKILLIEIIKDSEIQNNILYDYVMTLSIVSQTEFLNAILNLPLNCKQFSHNLHTIYIAYKNCNKTNIIQNHLLTLLKSHSQYCSEDKNYGKLLLAYLQEEISFKHKIDRTDLQNIIETHQTVFKRLCFNILNELNDD